MQIRRQVPIKVCHFSLLGVSALKPGLLHNISRLQECELFFLLRVKARTPHYAQDLTFLVSKDYHVQINVDVVQAVDQVLELWKPAATRLAFGFR